jgi:molybdopterin-guanine dinucleotide biosynthesis protein A
MRTNNKLFGLVVCGGKSNRMGEDKGLQQYYNEPQRYHVYEMLEELCDEVFISCNKEQLNQVNGKYKSIVDLPAYAGKGPVTGLLSAFEQYPGTDFLAIGCDYPFLKTEHLTEFANSIDKENIAAAFYNNKEKLYEPVLAWYSYSSKEILKDMFARKEYSLQYFLRSTKSGKFYPVDEKVIESVDTMDRHNAVKKELNAN